MHEIPNEEVSPEFIDCWKAAVRHVDSFWDSGLQSWLKCNLLSPFLEHFSFRIGNRLFFVRIEDVDGRLKIPGSLWGLQRIAEACGGTACLMRMKRSGRGWGPYDGGWGLVDHPSLQTIDPHRLVTDELVEMTDWEVHSFGIQVVRHHISEKASVIETYQDDPELSPSIWYTIGQERRYVIVRTCRYPAEPPQPDSKLTSIVDRLKNEADGGDFAALSVASINDAFDPSGEIPATPLWRGHGLTVKFAGLQPLML